MVVFGSALMIKLMARFPVIVTFGACLIGWVGGETIASDVALREFSADNPWLHYTAATVGALAVLAIGKYFQAKHTSKEMPDASA
jgi:predicted tellurium resistance membrane protein TerC